MKLKNFLLLISCLFYLLFYGSCLDAIDFDVPKDFQDAAVITGKLIKGNPSIAEVRIQNLFDFSFEDAIYVTAQSVKIVNEKGEELELPLQRTAEYSIEIYPDSSFEVEIGQKYHVEVEFFNGKSFKSTPAELLAVPKMENVDFEFFQKDVPVFRRDDQTQTWIRYFMNGDLLSPDSSEPKNLKWEFQRTYKLTDDGRNTCYLTGGVSFDLIAIVNSELVNSTSLVDFPVLEQLVSSTMVEGQYVTFIQEALDDGAYKYWEQVRELSTNSGTFYEAPPGQLISNIETTNGTEGAAFGYFYASEQDTLRFFIDSTSIDLTRGVCPRLTFDSNRCDECCDCTIQFGSTTEKPDYWIR